MARYIDVQHQPSFGERLTRGLASGATTAAQVIPEHYVNRQRGNSLADLAGIQGEQRQSFMGLAPQQQEKFYDKLIKDRASTKKHFEDQLKYIDTRFDKHIQENDLEGIDRDPYKELVKSYIKQGYSAPEAFDLAKAEALRDKPAQQDDFHGSQVSERRKGSNRSFLNQINEPLGAETFKNALFGGFEGPKAEGVRQTFQERQRESAASGARGVFEKTLPWVGPYLTKKAEEAGGLPFSNGPEREIGGGAAVISPGGLVSKLVQWGGGTAAGVAALTKIPALVPFARLFGGSLTLAELGALDVYGATGEHPSAEEVGKSLLTYAGLGAALQVLGKASGFRNNLKTAAKYAPKAPAQITQQVSEPTSGGPPSANPLAPTPQGPQQKPISRKAQALKATMDQAKSAGVDMDKLAAGDPKEAAVVSAILENNVAKVKEANKSAFNPKSAVKERELMQKLLPESPLEAYMEPQVEPTHTPETIAKREAIKAELEPVQQDLYRKLSNAQDQQRKLLFDIKRAKTPAERERLHAIQELRNGEIADMQQQLRDVKYQLKHFRPRATPEEIEKQIDKAEEVFRSEAANPTEAGQKKIERAIELDQKFLESAKKILDRGELPGEVTPDTFIKMKQAYLARYKALLEDIKYQLKSLGGAKNKEATRDRERLKTLQGYINGRVKRLNADIINQTDKIKAIKALKGPSGALMKEQIKGLRKDIQELQKVWVEHVQHKNPTQFKTHLTAKERIESLSKLQKEIEQNPTIEKIGELAEHAGVDKEAVKNVMQKLQSHFEQASKYVQEGGELPPGFDPVKEAQKELDIILKSSGPQTPQGAGPRTQRGANTVRMPRGGGGGGPPGQPPGAGGGGPPPPNNPPPGSSGQQAGGAGSGPPGGGGGPPPNGPTKNKAKEFLKKAFKAFAGSWLTYYGLKRAFNFGQELVDEHEADKALESRKPSEIGRLKTKWRARGYSDPKIKKLIKQAQASRKLKRA